MVFASRKAHFQAGAAQRVGKLLSYEGGRDRVGAFQRHLNVGSSSRARTRRCGIATLCPANTMQPDSHPQSVAMEPGSGRWGGTCQN